MVESGKKKLTDMTGYVLKNISEWKTMQNTMKKVSADIFGGNSIIHFERTRYSEHLAEHELHWLKCQELDSKTAPKAQFEHDRKLHRWFES
mmetsp:Transcript_26937/g.32667  ORF Transcript_26937/g.32667 Transcript_26937/m.32667 type:complete len:91 (-) Transcript_26937:4-276(-)